MRGKIEISRELAERLLNFTCNEEYDELRKILAAPVVERQPVAMYQRCTILKECSVRSSASTECKDWPTAYVAVPDGWKLVPSIATLEMKNAGWRECDRQGVDPESIEMQTIWAAMNLAAPACLDKELNQ